MRRFLCLLFILPLRALAHEHSVPVGTGGNRLLFTVKNTLPLMLRDIKVAIESTPDWMEFEIRTMLR